MPIRSILRYYPDANNIDERKSHPRIDPLLRRTNRGNPVLRKPIAGISIHPARVWIVLLALILGAEYGVMLILPWIFPKNISWFAESAADAVLLTLIVAPMLWWTVVRPLQQIISIRARYLADLFSQIEAERRRIAFELHDGIGQSLTMLVSGLRTLQTCPAKPDLPQRLLELQQISQVTLKDLRQLALGLRPSLLDDLGLAPAIEQVAANIVENHHPLRLTVDVEEIAGARLPGAVETAVFRIFQEALNNIIKHSSARKATVRVCIRGRDVVLHVSDDGQGFETGSQGRPHHQTERLGMISMGERAILLGGTLSIDSEPGNGTRIVAAIPRGDEKS